MTHDKLNIVLVGMAGCGKSSVGKMLARIMHMSFIDTDDLIVEKQGRPLQQIIDSEGSLKFKRIVEEVLLDTEGKNAYPKYIELWFNYVQH